MLIFFALVKVKAKYKARAKHFERKFQQIERANSRLLDEMTALRRTLTLHGSAGGASRQPNQELRSGQSAPTAGVHRDVSANEHVTRNDNSTVLTPADRAGLVLTPLSPPLSLGEQSPSTAV